MKKFIVILLLSLGVTGQTNANNATWVSWVNNSSHNGTPGEFAEMLNYIHLQNPGSAVTLELTTGTRCRIACPQLWFNNMLMCYQRIDQSVNADNLALTVQSDPQIYWDENISVLTKNYYCVNNSVLFANNYSGAKTRRLTGMHNGSPVYLASCGNPQEAIAPVAPPQQFVQQQQQPSQVFYYPNGGQQEVYVVKTSSADVNINNSGNTNVTYQQPKDNTGWYVLAAAGGYLLGSLANNNHGYRPYYQQPFSYYPQYQWPTRTMPNAIGASGQTFIDNGGGTFFDGTLSGYSRTMPSGL